jgi:phosphoribosylaminoimidazole-succinocarboxamide synthase
MENFLTKDEARRLVDDYMDKGDKIYSTQEIIDSGKIPELKGFTVRPGKVSDCIYGGKDSFMDKKAGQTIEFDNPELVATDGTPLRIMVRTTRISTHDVNRGEIPFKDQILATNHNFMRKLLAPAIGTSQYDVQGLSDNSVVIVAEDLKNNIDFENVLRAYMAKSSTSTSLYVHYMNGER